MAPISVKESALVAIIIESFLYGRYAHCSPFAPLKILCRQGISTFLFGITVWSLIYQRNSAQVAYSMLIAACLLFFLSTMVRSLVYSMILKAAYLSTHSTLSSVPITCGKALFPHRTQPRSSRISAKLRLNMHYTSWRLSLAMQSLSVQSVAPVAPVE